MIRREVHELLGFLASSFKEIFCIVLAKQRGLTYVYTTQPVLFRLNSK